MINDGKHATPTTARIDLYYTELALERRWDLRRYDRLCEFLRLTRYEMASLICLSHAKLEQHIKRNRFNGPTALLLTLIEANILKNWLPEEELAQNTVSEALKCAYPHG